MFGRRPSPFPSGGHLPPLPRSASVDGSSGRRIWTVLGLGALAVVVGLPFAVRFGPVQPGLPRVSAAENAPQMIAEAHNAVPPAPLTAPRMAQVAPQLAPQMAPTAPQQVQQAQIAPPPIANDLWQKSPKMKLEGVYAGPLRDTIVQRWRDPIDGTLCYIYLPINAPTTSVQASGFVQYGAATIGSISCFPTAPQPPSVAAKVAAPLAAAAAPAKPKPAAAPVAAQ